jgi:hypothetical protein
MPSTSKQPALRGEGAKVRLFVREKGRVIDLTDAGRTFVEEARSALCFIRNGPFTSPGRSRGQRHRPDRRDSLTLLSRLAGNLDLNINSCCFVYGNCYVVEVRVELNEFSFFQISANLDLELCNEHDSNLLPVAVPERECSSRRAGQVRASGAAIF